MTIKECATFLTGGSATVEMIKECISLMVASDIKEKNIKKFRVMVGPMDMVSFLLCSIMILLCFALI
jgi:hypothetical protein